MTNIKNPADLGNSLIIVSTIIAALGVFAYIGRIYSKLTVSKKYSSDDCKFDADGHLDSTLSPRRYRHHCRTFGIGRGCEQRCWCGPRSGGETPVGLQRR